MRPNQAMCADLDMAKLNRERVKTSSDLAYYEAQSRAVAQWEVNESKPASIVLGDLPYVGRHGTDRGLDRD